MMPRRQRSHAGLVVGVLGAVGCGSDVRLGGVSPDAAAMIDAPLPADANPGAFAPGSYALTFHDPVDIVCDGSSVGQEAAFTGISQADEGITDGAVTLSAGGPTLTMLSGPAIAANFQRAALELVPSEDPEGEREIWDTTLAGDARPGPMSTTRASRYFGLDADTAGQPAVEAVIAAFYETAAQDGGCIVAFRAVLAPQ